MALASGLDSQFGYAEESTPGTIETPNRFIEFNDEDIKLEVERIDSKGIRAGRRTLHRWAPGVQRVVGTSNHEFGPEGSGLLLEHMFGTLATTGAGDPYTHTASPGDMGGRSMTVQINRPDITGTDRVFTYSYMKITDWTFSAAVNDFLMLKLGWYGADENRSTGLATASYPSDFEPFTFVQGALTIAGTEICVTDFDLNGDNGLKTDRHFICAAQGGKPKEAIESSLRKYDGSFTADFESLTNYERFVNGTEAALVLTFDRASDDRSMVITMNVRFDGDTPTVSGQELLENSFKFVCTSGTSDAAAITVALENGDSSA